MSILIITLLYGICCALLGAVIATIVTTATSSTRFRPMASDRLHTQLTPRIRIKQAERLPLNYKFGYNGN